MLQVVIDEHQVRIGQRFAVSFQRTLRIPNDGRVYPLPPGLGAFPLLKADNYLDRVPATWRGRALIPMYQREALWLGFGAASWKPNAVKIAIGGVNALTGEADDNQLRDQPQNYLVCPNQPWLDGIHTGQGTIRQFVAMPLGQGYTVEAAITGAETVGGIQIAVFEPKPGRFPDQPPPVDLGAVRTARPMSQMGLGAGGMIRQKIYPDPYGLDTWDQENYGRACISIINSLQFESITGKQPPATPIDAKTYTQYGFPWFELYDEAKADLAPSERLGQVSPIADPDAEGKTDPDSFEVPETQVKYIKPQGDNP